MKQSQKIEFLFSSYIQFQEAILFQMSLELMKLRNKENIKHKTLEHKIINSNISKKQRFYNKFIAAIYSLRRYISFCRIFN